MTLHDNFEWDEDKAQKNLKNMASHLMMSLSFSRTRMEVRFTWRSTTASTVLARIDT